MKGDMNTRSSESGFTLIEVLMSATIGLIVIGTALTAFMNGVEINDLYELVMRAGRDGQLGEDGIHFTEPGYARIGKAVADVIAVSLAR